MDRVASACESVGCFWELVRWFTRIIYPYSEVTRSILKSCFLCRQVYMYINVYYKCICVYLSLCTPLYLNVYNRWISPVGQTINKQRIKHQLMSNVVKCPNNQQLQSQAQQIDGPVLPHEFHLSLLRSSGFLIHLRSPEPLLGLVSFHFWERKSF